MVRRILLALATVFTWGWPKARGTVASKKGGVKRRCGRSFGEIGAPKARTQRDKVRLQPLSHQEWGGGPHEGWRKFSSLICGL